jgi:acyl-[acyl-carrier-protein] desaturase
MHALYRWYVAHSSKRDWLVEESFDWTQLRPGHSRELMTIIEGFYAVEQYAPDYTSELLRLTRREYGRSQFYMRWGAEEEKHADLWRRTLLASKFRTVDELEGYTRACRENAWQLPFDTPVHMLVYTVFQERATEVIYLNTAKVARGAVGRGAFASDTDPILAKVASTIAADEAAHYYFFLESARLYLYYFPEETLSALGDVLRAFVMPAADIVPQYDAFIRELYAGNLFGRRKYVRDVVEPALEKLGVAGVRSLEQALLRIRTCGGGLESDNAGVHEVVDGVFLEKTMCHLFDRLKPYMEV